MKAHIGKILQEKLNEPGAPSRKDFAGLLGISEKTIYNLFNEESDLTLSQVVRASEILKYDLISEYLKAEDRLWLLNEPETAFKREKPITVEMKISAGYKTMGMHFADMLEAIKKEGDKYGFTIE
jgi:plasmid maintenance system antidote protein VapI